MTEEERRNNSIKCTQKYTKTEGGLITRIYAAQRHHSKVRNYPYPSYTKEELTTWLYAHNFKELFSRWVKSGYTKNLVPSINRLNDYEGYTIGNIELMTWVENNNKYSEDTVKGVNTKHCKGVNKLTLDGEFIAYYYSQAQAQRETGINSSHISSTCKGSRPSAGGFKWELVVIEPDLLSIKEHEYKSHKGNTRVAVVQLTMGGLFIREHESQIAAAKLLGIGKSHITSVCTGKRKSTGGYRWLFKKDYKETT